MGVGQIVSRNQYLIVNINENKHSKCRSTSCMGKKFPKVPQSNKRVFLGTTSNGTLNMPFYHLAFTIVISDFKVGGHKIEKF